MPRACRRRRRLVGLWGVLALVACTEPVQRNPSTLNVSIDADQVVRKDAVSVELVIETQSEPGHGYQDLGRRTFRADPKPIEWPVKLDFILLPGSSDATFSLVAIAFDRAGSVVARAQAIRDRKRALESGLRVHFETACFRQPTLCDYGLTCSDGECVDARLEQPPQAPPDTDPTDSTSADPGSTSMATIPLGLAKDGDACASESALACPEHGARSALRCVGGTWRMDAACANDERCDTEEGPTLGLCRPVARECLNRQPDVPFCDGDMMLVCTDLVSSKPRPCTDNARCTLGPIEAQCACKPSFVKDGLLCREATECDTENGGCDSHTACLPAATGRTCTVCPDDYTGTGEEGCAPLLRSLSVNAGEITPELSPDTRSYRIRLPLVAPTVALTATAPDDTRIAFDSLVVAPGEAFSATLSTRKETTIELTLTSSFDITTRYELVVERSGSQDARIKASNPSDNDQFGYDVAISADTLVAGAPFEDSAGTGVDAEQVSEGATDSGAAYVFTRDAKGWSQQAYLKASDSTAKDHFGACVCVDGDTVVVSAGRAEYGLTPDAAGRPGVAYVFTRSQGKWVEQQKLTPGDSAAGDLFGVKMELKGDTLLIGAQHALAKDGTRVGAIYVFERDAGMWVERDKLTADGLGTGSGFGESFALEGDYLVAGAAWTASRSGTAFVFERSAAGFEQKQLLQPTSVAPDATFGFRTAIQDRRIAVTKPYIAADNPALAPIRPPGEVHIYELSGDRWQETELVRAPAGESNDWFGSGLVLTEHALIVGANGESGSSTGIGGDYTQKGAAWAGAAFVFAPTREGWLLADYVKADNASASDSFGWTASLSPEMMVVAAPAESTDGHGVNDPSNGLSINSGAVYVFR